MEGIHFLTQNIWVSFTSKEGNRKRVRKRDPGHDETQGESGGTTSSLLFPSYAA
jgi:hypothetical protein